MDQEKEKNYLKNQKAVSKINRKRKSPKKKGEQEFQEETRNFKESNSASNYLSAKGSVRFKMTNDYLFRAVFQTNTKALKGLLCSMLHLEPKEIQTIEITNPIELGKSLDDKTFVLDITLKLNDCSMINIEMQISNWLNWPERSLSYLCRTFDNLMSGEDYLKVKPVTQICFLDFTLFPQFPEFYASYQMLNTKNHNLYSDKFTLSVVDLTQADLATEEDKANGIDQWAALFKATKWEEIKMLSQKNEYLEEASQSMYQLSADERIRQQCAAREENERLERAMRKTQETLDKTAAELDKRKTELNTMATELDTRSADLDTKATELNTMAAELDTKAADLDTKAADLDTKAANLDTKAADLDTKAADLDTKAADLELQKAQLREWEAQLKELENKLKGKVPN